MMHVWVLCYILRFPGEDGEWAQAVHRAYSTEAEAYAKRAQMGDSALRYSVCKVVVTNARADHE